MKRRRVAHEKFIVVAILLVSLAINGAAAYATLIYTPPNFQSKTARVVVVIHGCKQSAEIMALGTGFNRLAARANLAVIYPQIPAGSNAIECWNWYLPENQRRDGGQLKFVMDTIDSSLRQLRLVSPDIYVTGISSGGATTAGLLACYPERFKGGAIHSGPSYGVAQNLQEAVRVLRDGPTSASARLPCDTNDFAGRLLVIQGLADEIVDPLNADRVLSDFKQSKSRLVKVEELGHAWAGYPAPSPTRLSPPPPYFSETGPDATILIWDFFNQH